MENYSVENPNDLLNTQLSNIDHQNLDDNS